MFRKMMVLTAVVMMISSVYAEPKMAVLNPKGKEDASEFAKKLGKEIKLIFKTVKDVVLLDGDKVLSPNDKSALNSCSTKWKCVAEKSRSVKNVDFVLFPVVKMVYGAPNVSLYIFSTKSGAKVAKPVVKGEADTDAEDLAADIAGSLIDVASNLSSDAAIADDADDEDGGSSSADSEPVKETPKKAIETGLSEREKKNRLRSGFKAYKSGDAQSAVTLFTEGGDSISADLVNEIATSIEKAKQLLKEGNSSEAVKIVKRIENGDIQLREKGYKELQFIKETSKKNKYNEPTEADYTKVKNLFKDIKKDIRTVAEWKQQELSKLDDSMRDQLRERDKITRDFEKAEKSKREQEKQEEADHLKKIEKMKSDLENLDAKYRDKIGDVEREINSLNKKLDDSRAPEEVYKTDIENDQKELDKKYKKMTIDLKKELLMAQKQLKDETAKTEKEIETQLKDIEKANADLDRQIQALSKEIEKMSADFDKNEQKESQAFEKSLAAFEAADRKDRDDLEKKSTAEIEALNKETEVYDKKIQDLSAKIDALDREISEYTDKQEQRIQKMQEANDKKREELEKKFDTERSAAEAKAEKEYEKKQAELAKKIEILESSIIKIEDKVENYEKSAEWKNARKNLKDATDELVKFEEGHDKFIAKETGPIVENHKKAGEELDGAFKKFEGTVKKEIADYKAKKGSEKAALDKELKALEKGRGAFEKGLQKKIADANTARENAMKAIEKRSVKRDSDREAQSKARKAEFDKSLEAKRKQLASLEKQIAANSANAEKTRNALTDKLDKFRVASEKKISDLEIANEKKKEALELQQEKERQTIYQKYEQKAEQARKDILAKISQLENNMKNLVGQRGKEETTLRANIEAAEKQTDTMQSGWATDAKKRLATYEANLKAAEKREVAAKAKYESSKKSIDNQYKSKVDALIQKASGKNIPGEAFKVERDRNFEFSAYTKMINAVKAEAYIASAKEKLAGDDITGARKDVFDAIYADSDSNAGTEALKEIEKAAGALYERAYQAVTEDPETAKKILIKLRKELDPYSPYYLKVLALIEDLKLGE